MNRRQLVTAGIASVAIPATAAAQSRPVTRLFQNSGYISIPERGAATPYPSVIRVAGYARYEVVGISVILRGFSHEFPSDVDVILQAPGGKRVWLMNDEGGSYDTWNVTLSISDQGPRSMSCCGQLLSGQYLPSNPFFPRLQGVSARGIWRLFVSDDYSGDVGSIAAGWALRLRMQRR